MKLLRGIPIGFAVKLILFITTLILVFHGLVILEIIPYKYVWNGKLKSVKEMYIFEGYSVFWNILILIVVLIRGELIQPHMPISSAKGFSWIFFVILMVNTTVNLVKMDTLMSQICPVVTFILAILFLRLAIKEKAVL